MSLTSNNTELQNILATINALPEASGGGGRVETCTVKITSCQDVFYTGIENGQLVAKHSAGASNSSDHTFTACRYSIIMCGNTLQSGESGIDSYGYMLMGYSDRNYYVAQITDAEAKISFSPGGHGGGSND